MAITQKKEVERVFCMKCNQHSLVEVRHKYSCDCGHIHDNHHLSGGCKEPGCPCPRYSQKNKRRYRGGK